MFCLRLFERILVAVLLSPVKSILLVIKFVERDHSQVGYDLKKTLIEVK